MNKFNKSSIVVALVTALVLSFVGPSVAFAITATAPSLGTASTFSVLGGGLVSADGSGATVSGDLGYTTKTGGWVVGGTEYVAGAAAGALSDATNAWTTMGSTGGTAWDPAVDISPTPGLYTRSGDATFAGPTLTLSGSATDVWVFQINSSLTFTGNVVLTGGAQACNVFWRVATSATINSGGAGSKFVGTLIANSNVSTVGGATIDGRLMALTGTVSTAGVTSITVPTCMAAAAVSSRQPATINVVKVVINDGGGTKKVSDFPLFVNGTPVVSGITKTFPAPAALYKISETYDSSKYKQSFSGDCDLQGGLNLIPGDNKFCIITNNDIGTSALPPVPPLIDVVKVASPLSLPGGPGQVTYTYTLKNIGTVPVSNVTMVDDSCAPVILVAGDVNADSRIDVGTTWTFQCVTTLSETHTNTVVATGWANGISAVDIASATVVVGAAIVPPLIHITKTPNIFVLQAGGGMVTYTKIVTNPGTVPLHNVRLTDNQCSPIYGPFGDANNDNLLDPSESWAYACRTKLIETTTNTAFVTGEANGLIARDFAIATVVVAIPKLPNTGFPPSESILWLFVVAGTFAAIIPLNYLRRKYTK